MPPVSTADRVDADGTEFARHMGRGRCAERGRPAGGKMQRIQGLDGR